jgi:hypothetical protein
MKKNRNLSYKIINIEDNLNKINFNPNFEQVIINISIDNIKI